MTKAQPVDWFRIVADLKRLGLSARDVERRTGIPKSTLISWTGALASEPRHQSGEALIALWVQVTGLSRDHLPRLQTSKIPTAAGR